jgi:hypothetical protein
MQLFSAVIRSKESNEDQMCNDFVHTMISMQLTALKSVRDVRSVLSHSAHSAAQAPDTVLIEHFSQISYYRTFY